MEETIDHIDVLKVGTNVLVKKYEDGTQGLNWNMFQRIGRQASGRGYKVLVSSAAITAGLLAVKGHEELRRTNGHLNMANGLLEVQAKIFRPDKKTEMPELQRLASIGWRHIHNAWDAHIQQKTTGGLLLTRQELGQRQEREEALRVLYALLSNSEVPIVNENDSITHDEIAFGDNDTLAATLAVKIAQSNLFGKHVRLFLISDIDGVYVDRNDANTRIPVIENTDDYRHLAFDTASKNGTGGMITKFDAADIAHAGGVDMWIYNGMRHANYAVRGESGTYFPAK